jgi:hypothetical protein
MQGRNCRLVRCNPPKTAPTALAHDLRCARRDTGRIRSWHTRCRSCLPRRPRACPRRCLRRARHGWRCSRRCWRHCPPSCRKNRPCGTRRPMRHPSEQRSCQPRHSRWSRHSRHHRRVRPKCLCHRQPGLCLQICSRPPMAGNHRKKRGLAKLGVGRNRPGPRAARQAILGVLRKQPRYPPPPAPPRLSRQVTGPPPWHFRFPSLRQCRAVQRREGSRRTNRLAQQHRRRHWLPPCRKRLHPFRRRHHLHSVHLAARPRRYGPLLLRWSHRRPHPLRTRHPHRASRRRHMPWHSERWRTLRRCCTSPRRTRPP